MKKVNVISPKGPAVSLILLITLPLMLVSCFTGVEGTKKVSDKDVSKAISRSQTTMKKQDLLVAYKDSVPAWRQGKRFYVTDSQVKLIFAPSNSVNSDTLQLSGKTLVYDGYSEGGVLDNRKTVNLMFSDSNNKYIYPTNKEIQEFNSQFQIPFLIDEDMVAFYSKQLSNKDFWIKTALWYDVNNERMIKGRQFVKVHVERVEPGNKVFPLKVVFSASDSGQEAFVWIATNVEVMKDRDFGSLFTTENLRERHKDITDANWARITNCQVVEGMTKEECKLSLGTPKQVKQRPTYDGLNEIWYYDGGSFLLFADGLLKDFRK